jgi:DNA-binding FadR family transcriptional regulator
VAATSKVRVPKTAELVADNIRRRIVRGELLEDDSLPPEAELMEQFGVSRPTLREAFRVLESEGLIAIRRGSRGGARILTPSPEVAAKLAGLVLQVRGTKISDVYEARLLIEPAAAGMLAKAARAKQISQLGEVLQQEQDAIGDSVAFAHASARFHEQVIELAGNQTLAVFAEILAEIIDRHTQVVMSEASDSPEGTKEMRRAHRSHERLLELVTGNDADGAEEHWREHMEAIGHHMLNGRGSKTLIDLFA